jgi:hypothetical protein
MLLLGSVLTILLPFAANLHYIALIVIRFLIGASLVSIISFILKFVLTEAVKFLATVRLKILSNLKREVFGLQLMDFGQV